jgi:hypothetical protein
VKHRLGDDAGPHHHANGDGQPVLVSQLDQFHFNTMNRRTVGDVGAEARVQDVDVGFTFGQAWPAALVGERHAFRHIGGNIHDKLDAAGPG